MKFADLMVHSLFWVYSSSALLSAV